MTLQLIQYGNNTGVFVPMTDWTTIVEKHNDLKEVVITQDVPTKKKLSELAGCLSKTTGQAMQDYVTQSRNEWDERLKNQF